MCVYPESGQCGSVFYRRWPRSAGVGDEACRTDWRSQEQKEGATMKTGTREAEGMTAIL